MHLPLMPHLCGPGHNIYLLLTLILIIILISGKLKWVIKIYNAFKRASGYRIVWNKINGVEVQIIGYGQHNSIDDMGLSRPC